MATNTNKPNTNKLNTNKSNNNKIYYIKIPNRIIHDSFTKNNFILPVYLYSYTHRDINRDCLVDTSVNNIMNYFKVSDMTVRGIEKDVLKGMNEIEVFKKKYTDEEIEEVLLKDCTPKQIKEMYFEYKFDESKFIKDVENKYTLIKLEDYYKILNMHRMNGIDSKMPGKDSRMCIELINYFCFLKMKIGLEYAERCKIRYKEIAEGKIDKNDLKYSKQSVIGLANYIKKSSRTVSNRVDNLEKIGIIKIERGGNSSKIY